MPLISVVIPIHNVEAYLRECLQSVSRQTVGDLEVIMVDDGSTDGSAAIAREFAERDPRFRLVQQPNGGLGQARNRGADEATGEFLAFVDGDDVLPRNAYELLLEPLRKTGSDFATGNVYRLASVGTSQSRFLAKVFVQTRLRTHVTRFRPLLADRIVPNKLWRRSFWDKHRYRFPEGVAHEDIPVVLPAQFAARSVDVIAEPVYLYRIREGIDVSDQSITQRRLDRSVLLDRVAAVEHVRDYLAREGPRKARRWYEQSAVAEDLLYFLNVLDNADEDYREVFLDRVNAFLDHADKHVYDELLAIDRLKWHLVRRRLMPELLEVLRFQRERMRDTPPVRIGRHWYGDYPFRTDAGLGIPPSVYRLEKELPATPHVDHLSWDDGRLRVEGYVYVHGIGAPHPDSQRVRLTAARVGRFQGLWQRLWPVRLATFPAHRPEATANSRQALTDLEWSGFTATLDPRRLRRAGQWREGTWELYATVRAGGVTRRRVRFGLDAIRPARAVDEEVARGVVVRASPTPNNKVAIEVRRHWATISAHSVEGDTVVLSGELAPAPADGAAPKLRIVGPGMSRRLQYPLEVGPGDPAPFSVRVPLADLDAQAAEAERAHGGDHRHQVEWDLYAVAGNGRQRVGLADGGREPRWPVGGRELLLARTQYGDAALIAGPRQAVVTEARWTGDGELELRGDLHAPGQEHELVLHSRGRLEQHRVPLVAGPAVSRFEARVSPARIATLGGELPLREGTWDLHVRPTGETALAPLLITQACYGELPLRTVVDGKPFALGMTPEQQAVLVARRNLADDERGGFHQRRLRETVYLPRRAEALRESVVYLSFGGRQYSCNPRAVHEELARRGAPLEHLWVVRDGMVRVPESAGVLRMGSREYYEALARSRFVVANDHLPDWFERRSGQVVLQTWHGSPLKLLGTDLLEVRPGAARAAERWIRQAGNWQYLLSPNRYATPIFRRAYDVDGEVLETGYPRDDALAGPGREERAQRLRERLGLGDARVVLYAPTFRDHIRDSRGRYRLNLQIDLDRLRRSIDPGTVLLIRKHHRVAEVIQQGGNGFVRDVSTFPDGTELLLAADVLVTDYSSTMFDFANTGRPMLFFTYDLEAYRDQSRGLYLDLAEQAPGPLLRTTDELAGALNDLDSVTREYAQRYRRFADTFCEFDDGAASARVVERVFSW